MNITELVMMLREKDIFNINEVDYAILEINGKLSVLKKVKYRNVTNNDLNIPITKPKYMPTQVILDGRLISKI